MQCALARAGVVLTGSWTAPTRGAQFVNSFMYSNDVLHISGLRRCAAFTFYFLTAQNNLDCAVAKLSTFNSAIIWFASR